MKATSAKGFRDILPDEAAARRCILTASASVLECYGFDEIETPLLERAELFAGSVGETSDIVEKEMYAFEDRDGSHLALRPEGTASVVRAYVERGLARSSPVAKLYYRGPMFRRERPQKGRFRQFTQVGAELIGRDDPASDAETICLADDICRANGVADVRIEINSLGDGACRPAFRDALAAYGHERENELCEDCRARAGRNPMRLLDCKQPGCRELMVSAPAMEDFLCSDCRSHHDAVLALLAEAGVETAPNPAMVRGLDYYCRTAFELVSSRLGAQDAIGGGGRYDGLVEALGGPDVGGVGFAFGLERMLMAAETGAGVEAPRFFVAPVGEAAAAACLRLARRLRSAGHKTETGSPLRRLKAQMKSADRRGARFVVIVGTDELAAGRATVRDMEAKSDHPLCVGLSEDAETVVAAVSALSGDGNES